MRFSLVDADTRNLLDSIEPSELSRTWLLVPEGYPENQVSGRIRPVFSFMVSGHYERDIDKIKQEQIDRISSLLTLINDGQPVVNFPSFCVGKVKTRDDYANLFSAGTAPVLKLQWLSGPPVSDPASDGARLQNQKQSGTWVILSGRTEAKGHARPIFNFTVKTGDRAAEIGAFVEGLNSDPSKLQAITTLPFFCQGKVAKKSDYDLLWKEAAL